MYNRSKYIINKIGVKRVYKWEIEVDVRHYLLNFSKLDLQILEPATCINKYFQFDDTQGNISTYLRFSFSTSENFT